MTTITLRRGQESNRSTITPVAGEPLVSLDDQALYIGDGETAGGFPIGTVKTSGVAQSGYVAIFNDDTGRVLRAIDINSFLGDYAKKTTVDTKFTTIDSQITNIQATTAQATAEVGTLSESLNEVSGDLSVTNSNVSNLTQQVTTVTQQANDNQSAIQGVSTVANGAQSTANNNTTSLISLTDRVETLESSGLDEQVLVELRNDIDANTTAIANKPDVRIGQGQPSDATGRDGDFFIEIPAS